MKLSKDKVEVLCATVKKLIPGVFIKPGTLVTAHVEWTEDQFYKVTLKIDRPNEDMLKKYGTTIFTFVYVSEEVFFEYFHPIRTEMDRVLYG